MFAGKVWELERMKEEGGPFWGTFLCRGSFGLGVKSSSRDGGPARLCTTGVEEPCGRGDTRETLQ
jgi:hypothetical protein